MSPDFDALLRECGALLEGHFLLSSGRHSDTYIEKFRILERPAVLAQFCAPIAQEFANAGIEIVAGPTTGGVIVAYEVARQLGIGALYIETADGRRTLRRGAELREGTRVLLVDDVLTTGLSLRESLEVLRERGADVRGAGVLIDRSEGPIGLDVPIVATHRVPARSFPPDEVPGWLADRPVEKPGTRGAPTR
jgi:orotate phosphoribosyltransferase